jgi:MFS family permease
MKKVILYFTGAIIVGTILLWLFSGFLDEFNVLGWKDGKAVTYHNGYYFAISAYIGLVLLVFFIWIFGKIKIDKEKIKIKPIGINTVLKIFIMFFLVFLSYIMYKSVENKRYIKIKDRYIYDKWKKEAKDIYDLSE